MRDVLHNTTQNATLQQARSEGLLLCCIAFFFLEDAMQYNNAQTRITTGNIMIST